MGRSKQQKQVATRHCSSLSMKKQRRSKNANLFLAPSLPPLSQSAVKIRPMRRPPRLFQPPKNGSIIFEKKSSRITSLVRSATAIDAAAATRQDGSSVITPPATGNGSLPTILSPLSLASLSDATLQKIRALLQLQRQRPSRQGSSSSLHNAMPPLLVPSYVPNIAAASARVSTSGNTTTDLLLTLLQHHQSVVSFPALSAADLSVAMPSNQASCAIRSSANIPQTFLPEGIASFTLNNNNNNKRHPDRIIRHSDGNINKPTLPAVLEQDEGVQALLRLKQQHQLHVSTSSQTLRLPTTMNAFL